MLLNDLRNEVISVSGAFSLPSEQIEVDAEKFRDLVQNSLREYNEHRPYTTKFTLTTTALAFTFLPGFTIALPQDTNVIGPPDSISELIPQRLSGIGAVLQQQFFRRTKRMDPSLERMYFFWEYRNPTLTTLYIGTFDVAAVYYHRITQTDEDEPEDQITTITTERDGSFVKLVTGKFMQALGRNRRAFIITEIPLQLDGPELVAEGKEMEAEAMAEMEEKAKWWLAWR